MTEDRRRITRPKRETSNVLTCVVAIMARALDGGLPPDRVGRVAAKLLDRAKAESGLRFDAPPFAPADGDGFADVFRALRASVDPDLDLSF